MTDRLIARNGLAVLACIIMTACGKKEPPPSKPAAPAAPAISAPAPGHPDPDLPTPKNFQSWSAEKQAWWHKVNRSAKQHWLKEEAREPAYEANRARIRRDYIRPAPAGFKPEHAGRKVKLTMVVENKTLHRNGTLKYRLELQNIGSEAIDFYQSSSDFLAHRFLLGPFHILITPHSGKERAAEHFMGVGKDRDDNEIIHFPGEEHMTEAQKDAAFQKMIEESELKHLLDAKLQPGESLVSKDDAGPPAAFHTLWTSFHFDALGTYRIRASFNDPPHRPYTEQELQRKEKLGMKRKYLIESYHDSVKEALGWVYSNQVAIEVVP